jgi:hypothetical protein
VSKGSKYRVTWSSTFARQYDKIFGKSYTFDLSNVITPTDVELDLKFKGGHNTERAKTPK